MTNYNDLAKEIHENAVAHGWWTPEPGFAESIAMIHSELSEALEEYRSGKPNIWFACIPTDVFAGCRNMTHCESKRSNLGCVKTEAGCRYKHEKPEGIAVELADAVMRILDFCGRYELDIGNWIGRREREALTLPQLVAECHANVSMEFVSGGLDEKPASAIQPFFLAECIAEIEFWLKEQGIDLAEIIRLKHEYNKTRPYRHGGKIL